MSSRQFLLTAILLLVSAFALAGTASAQDLTNWTEEGMRLKDGVDSTPLLLPDGRIRLYFGANSVNGGGIASATSNDGLNFTVDPGLRRPYSIYNGGSALLTRFVPVPGGGVRMFYSTGNNGGGIASAISSDGLNFTDETGLRLAWSDLGATNGTDGGTVVALPNGTYRMYIGITGASGTFATGYIRSATSPDMLKWTIEPGIRIGPGSTLNGGANHPFAIADGNGIITVFYWDDLFQIGGGKGLTGIKYATSADGINFSTETITTLNSGTANCQACFYGDQSVYPLPDGRLRIYFNRYEAATNTNTLWSATSNQLASGTAALISAVLPSSRSVQVGATATAFATIINAGLGAGLDCSIAPAQGFTGTFSYQTTNSTTNAPTGSPNTPATIRTGSGAAQSFVIALTPSSAVSAGDIQLSFACLNGAPAPSSSGLNTLFFSASTTPTPDVVALGATPSQDGILNIVGASGTGAFAVATANVGATGAITATADTGSATLPVTLTICQTNPLTGACLSPAAANATATIAANATPTFSIFAQGSGTIAFAPGTSRIFVRFKDSGGVTRGSTSVAVRTQ
jgi:hypothetical protein